MDSCRVARRIALPSQPRTARRDAESVSTLATKDMHAPVQSFPVSRRAGRRLVVERQSLVSGLGREWSAAGVCLFSLSRGARRVAWPAACVVPLCISPSLATKQHKRSDEV